jgi:hypothetical protein
MQASRLRSQGFAPLTAPARPEQANNQERDAHIKKRSRAPETDGDKSNGENQENHESVSHLILIRSTRHAGQVVERKES